MTSIVNAAPLRDDDNSKITLLTGPNGATGPNAVAQSGPLSSSSQTNSAQVNPGQQSPSSQPQESLTAILGTVPGFQKSSNTNTNSAVHSGGSHDSNAGDILVYYLNTMNPDHVSYGQCIPSRKNDNAINFTKFPKPTICTPYVDETCTNVQHPIAVLFLPNINIQNLAGVGSVLAGSYACHVASILKSPLEHPMHLTESPKPAVP
ncbi:unnamed protein product [Absidia cylindrospora]